MDENFPVYCLYERSIVFKMHLLHIALKYGLSVYLHCNLEDIFFARKKVNLIALSTQVRY